MKQNVEEPSYQRRWTKLQNQVAESSHYTEVELEDVMKNSLFEFIPWLSYQTLSELFLSLR